MPKLPKQAKSKLMSDISAMYDELMSRGIKESRDLWFLHSDSGPKPQDAEVRERMDRVIRILTGVNSKMISDRLVLDKLLYGPIASGLWFSHAFNKVKAEVEEIIDKLARYEAKRNVDVPLVNLRVGSTPRTIGLAIFHPIEASDREDSWWDRVESYAGPSAETEVVSFARVECSGDLQNSVDYAGWAVDETLLVVRAIGFPVVSGPQLQFGVLNDYPVWQSRPYRLHQPDQNFKLEFSSEMVEVLGPSIAPYDLDDDIIGSVKDEDLSRLQALVEAELAHPSNDMKTKFIMGLRWIGEATKPDTAAAKFTKLSFALEAFIGGDPGEPYLTSRGTTAALAEKGAYLAGISPSDRHDLHKAITKHYNQRSDIVHGRFQEIVDADLESFSSIIRRIMWSLLATLDSFENVSDLQKWVLDRRYGAKDQSNQGAA